MSWDCFWRQWRCQMTGCRLAGCSTLLGRRPRMPDCRTWPAFLAPGGHTSSRAKRSSCWHGGDRDAHVGDVGWCKATCGLIHQQTQLESYSFSDAEPMQLQVVTQHRSNVIAASATVYDSSGAVQDALQLV